jgi:hypothetical protein
MAKTVKDDKYWGTATGTARRKQCGLVLHGKLCLQAPSATPADQGDQRWAAEARWPMWERATTPPYPRRDKDGRELADGGLRVAEAYEDSKDSAGKNSRCTRRSMIAAAGVQPLDDRDRVRLGVRLKLLLAWQPRGSGGSPTRFAERVALGGHGMSSAHCRARKSPVTSTA